MTPKTRGPIVPELMAAIESMPGIMKVECHKYGHAEVCCGAHAEVSTPGATPTLYTSAYGANKLHALTRLLINVYKLRSGS